MRSKERCVAWGGVVLCFFLLPGVLHAKAFSINAHSAILIDMNNGDVLYEQNADALIPPASITKVLTLYLVFEAVHQGQIHLWDKVEISKRAATAPPSRMGLKVGQTVPLDELIKGMAVISGNDASIAVAEYVGGSVEEFVRMMNVKARQLGMRSTVFMTPNGLPAKGQLTTARDMAKLSIAYLRRFPESLDIHSMKSYTFNNRPHRNPNRLLGRCQGVDGLKTGFVCAAGYNLSATAKRGDERLLAVVLGAPSAGVRAAETAKLLEMGFNRIGSCAPEIREVKVERATDELNQSGRMKRFRITGTASTAADGGSSVRSKRSVRTAVRAKAIAAGKTRASLKKTASERSATSQAASTAKQARAANSKATVSVATAKDSRPGRSKKQSSTAKKSRSETSLHLAASAPAGGRSTAAKPTKAEKSAQDPRSAKASGKSTRAGRSGNTVASSKSPGSKQAKKSTAAVVQKDCSIRKSHLHITNSKKNGG